MFPDIMIRNRMSLHSDKAYGTSAKKLLCLWTLEGVDDYMLLKAQPALTTLTWNFSVKKVSKRCFEAPTGPPKNILQNPFRSRLAWIKVSWLEIFFNYWRCQLLLWCFFFIFGPYACMKLLWFLCHMLPKTFALCTVHMSCVDIDT